MSGLELFLKENKIKKENEFFAAASNLKDEKGDVLLWEIRRISTSEDEKIREECVKKTGKPDYGMYVKKVAAASVVYPVLYNAALQDSYGVSLPEELLVELIDIPGEYQEFIKFVQKINGFDVSIRDRVEKAKN